MRGALPRRYNHRVDPWSCRSADSLLDPSKTPPSVLPVLLMSNIGGTRWPRIGLSMGETARTQSRRMLELWGSRTGVNGVAHTTVVGVALRVAAIPSVVLVRRSFVRSVVSATISSVVVVSVARIPSVVVVSVARISSVVVVSVARICVARIYVVRIYVAQIYVARGFGRCSLVDGRFEVEVWTKSRRYSCGRERRARSWCVETARCCKVRGVTSFKELSKSLVHLLDAALLYTRPSLYCSW